MVRSVLAAAVLVLAAALPAHADPPVVVGTTCGLVTTSEPLGLLVRPDNQIGVVYSGDVAIDLLDGVLQSTITVTCDVKVGGTGAYGEPPAASATATGQPAAVPLNLVSYPATPNDPVWLCTTIVATDQFGSTVTWYHDAANDTLVQNPAGATCALAISQLVPPQEVCDLVPAVCDPSVINRPADVRVVVPRIALGA